jgi:ferritin-like metal-binding protein YciE
MSENQEFSAFKAEEASNQGFDPMAVLPAHVEKKYEGNTEIKDIDASLDGQSYFLGEVPQSYLADPQAFLALNSDKLVGSVNKVEELLAEVSQMIQEEVNQIQRAQKKINLWEDRIEKNKAVVTKNLTQVKQNLVDISYDKKNRDYWLSRAEQVFFDYEHAAAAGREGDWSWIVKKYGLKNPDGTAIDQKGNCVEELCNGAASNLESEYKIAGTKYETAKKDKEANNTRMIRENSRLLTTNEQLQGYISNVYATEIEPLQDGVLIYKELGVKLKALGQEGNKATYGDLRSWAELFLDEFLRANPGVAQHVVTEFRRLASIPLPAKNS